MTAVVVRVDVVNVEVCVFKNATEQTAGNLMRRDVFDVVDAADVSTYFTTAHATENILIRGQTYLKDKVAFFSDAVVV